MMPPQSRSVKDLSEETGITMATLYTWRKQARAAGAVMPGDKEKSEQWSSEEKFRVVLESASLNETELSEYCRRKGLYVEQVVAWREACEQANASSEENARVDRERDRAAQKRIRQLEREQKRDKAALSEAAALLLLRKKANAIWGDGEEG